MSNKIQRKSQKVNAVDNPTPANFVPPVRTTHVQQTFSGPVPPPAILNGYNEIVPGAAERILAMAEADALHRREIEAACISHEAAETKRGQVFGLTVCAMALGLCAFAAYIGQPWVASVVGGSTIVSLAVAFVQGRK